MEYVFRRNLNVHKSATSKPRKENSLFKQSLLLTLTICAAASLAISQPAYAQISEFKLTATDGALNDRFGKSVSIFGEYAVVGASFDDDNGTDAGSAYVVKCYGTIWGPAAELLGTEGAPFLFEPFDLLEGKFVGEEIPQLTADAVAQSIIDNVPGASSSVL